MKRFGSAWQIRNPKSPIRNRLARCLLLSAFCLILLLITHHSSRITVFAQSATATLSGTVIDQNGAVVPGVEITVMNPATALERQVTTNDAGYFTVPLLPPGQYVVTARRSGFAPAEIRNVVLNVGDQKALQIQLKAGDISATVQVINEPLLNTESAAVSTVVDRNFAENLPMNGRSFQTLIQLTPGVVVTPSTAFDSGQFSVNGQRTDANYWMVDGVSANIGVSSGNVPGDGIGGAVGSFSVLGGTNSLVSIDAMQEFRIQTSTYAPEFGRTPGGQISIVTRSGANRFHGTLFDYFRNDILDANDWFADSVGLPKPKERQHDFGGTFSGPLLKDRTFFFFSYEGLRLRLPQTTLTTVPDLGARTSAIPAVQPFLNAFPLPNGPDNLGTGVAQFNASYSSPATLDAYSIRVDHKLMSKVNLFGRYSYSPSELDQRGYAGTTVLSVLQPSRITTQTATAGTTWMMSSTVSNDLRFNYSRTNAITTAHLDNLGGALPFTTLPFPSPFSSADSRLFYYVISLGSGLRVGPQNHNLQRQINLVDNLMMQLGSHTVKIGADFRRLSPISDNPLYSQSVFFLNVPSASTGRLLFGFVNSGRAAALLFRNLGVFAQDTWRITPRLTLTYGLRWDVDFAPSTTAGPNFPAVTGFNLNDFSQLALAPVGTPPFRTAYGNVAPRIGVVYQLSQSQSWQTVMRGGFGVFFDLATSQAGTLLTSGTYPFLASKFVRGSFPLPSATATPPLIVPPSSTNPVTVAAFDPNLKLPYTLQWNIAIEQALGLHQSISASYVGAAGRRLIQSVSIANPNSTFTGANFVSNLATSDYNALQVQFQRRLSRGLQALASYSWAHSIDDASSGSAGNRANTFLPTIQSANRGPSDFDIRNAFSLGLTYDISAPRSNKLVNVILQGWSLQGVFQARSAPPVSLLAGAAFLDPTGNAGSPRPDIVPGQPWYLYGPTFPGGKAINPAAFVSPPIDPVTGYVALRQGNLGRNALRGFGAAQLDFAVHRDFRIKELVKLGFRAELFNVLNHPNFGPPVSDLSNTTQFGLATQMLGRSLTGFGGAGGGALNPLYQIGGPRSIQFALKLTF